MTKAFAAVVISVPVGVVSCEHCRAVTWAGQTACRCEFACSDMYQLEFANHGSASVYVPDGEQQLCGNAK